MLQRQGFNNILPSNLNQNSYQQIISDSLFPAANKIFGRESWNLVQDNTPCHNAKTTLELINSEAHRVMDFPAVSSDINPIENVWAVLKTRVNRRNPSNEDELRKFILEEWQNIDDDFIKTLIRTMPKRLEDIISLGGGFLRNRYLNCSWSMKYMDVAFLFCLTI